MIMININGDIKNTNSFRLASNRGFLYGDALFDTMLYRDERLLLSKEHYERLIESMRQLQMEIPTYFTYKYWEDEIYKILKANTNKIARVRTTIFRDSDGLFTPLSNTIQFIIQTSELDHKPKKNYTIGLYTDNLIGKSSINSIKTTSRLINVLASVYSKKNNFDNSLLLNCEDRIAEATNANIFLVFGNKIITPGLSEGCINGVIRKKIIELINNSKAFELIERSVFADELKNADEVFLTNSIVEIQNVSSYKKKSYKSDVSKKLLKKIQEIS